MAWVAALSGDKTARYPQPGIVRRPPDLPGLRPSPHSYNAGMFVHLRLHTGVFPSWTGTAHRRGRQGHCQGWATRPGDYRPEQPLWRHQVLQGRAWQGVKPILGAEVYHPEGEAGAPPARLLLLVQNRQGYLNLSELLARAGRRVS